MTQLPWLDPVPFLILAGAGSVLFRSELAPKHEDGTSIEFRKWMASDIARWMSRSVDFDSPFVKH